MEAQRQSSDRVAIDVEGISKRFGALLAVDNVSFTVQSGEIFGLLGPNGAGKSTTMRMASGLLRPRSGRVLLDGNDVTAVSPSRRARLGICHVMEGRSIFPSLSVRENLLLQAPAGASKAEIMDRTNQEFPQLTNRGKQLAGTLSGGEQQMLALMRAYLAQPRVVLVDEASLGLALVIVDQIFAFLQHIAGDGVSLLIVEQYAPRVLAIASAVYLLSQGSIVYSGPAGELDEEQIFALYAQQSAPGGRNEI